MGRARTTDRRDARFGAGIGRWWTGFAGADRGGVALLVALVAPTVFLVGLGAVQINAIVTDRQKTQDVADAAALWGAQQFTVTAEGAGARTIAFADAQLDGIRANAKVQVQAVAIGKNTIKVTIDTHRPSFFMNLMPAGGFNTHVESIAEGLSLSPLCVLIVGAGSGDDVDMGSQSKLQGPACLVHSNHAVKAGGAALIQAQQVEAVTTASGPISPTPSTGAPFIDDPFGGLSYDFPVPCLLTILDLDVPAPLSLPPGVHQFNYKIRGGAKLTLQPGDHYFCGDVELKEAASMIGDDVALVFGSKTKLISKDASDISLNGRKSGPLAGFVMLTGRTRTDDFKLDSDPISNITGTLYAPNAKLIVEGDKKSGISSAWTVLAARAFEGKGGANLMINVNYGGSDVPVPAGVGNRMGTTRLK